MQAANLASGVQPIAYEVRPILRRMELILPKQRDIGLGARSLIFWVGDDVDSGEARHGFVAVFRNRVNVVWIAVDVMIMCL